MSKQAEHPTLLIPGPIEFDDEVLQAMSHYRYAPLASDALPLSILNPDSQSIARQCTLRRHLRRNPHYAPQNLPNHAPRLAALRN